MPWLWSPSAEGMADIPYTYEARITRRVTSRSGKEAPPDPNAGGLSNWRSIQLQRIPLEWGSFMRCLSQDGRAPCSKDWTEELERQAKRREDLSAEDRTKIDRTREERRQRRRAFWDGFSAGLQFELTGPGQLRFKPSSHGSSEMLRAITGRLWFDASSHEITRLEYDLLRDVDEPFLRLQKGSDFAIELTGLGDHYFPARIIVRRRIGKAAEVEERTTVFSEFRRFDTDSKIQFADPQE